MRVLKRGLGVRAWLVMAALLVGACVAPWSSPAADVPGQWSLLGGRLNTGTACCAQTLLRMDATGNPTVAWVESSAGTSRLFVAAWRAGAWSTLGAALDSGNITLSKSSLALDDAGNPIVAWNDGATGYVSRWSGSAWLAVGGPFANVMNNQMAVLSVSPLVVSTYSSTIPPRSLTLHTWSGSSWTASGNRTLPGYSVSFPLSATVDSAGNPTVAWRGLRPSGGSSDWDLVVEQWSAGSWARLGGVLNVNPAWGVSDAQIRAAGGVITVAWGEIFFRQPGMNYVKQWSGGAWQQLGETVGTNALAVDANGMPTVGGSGAVRSWDGSSWGLLGDSANLPTGGSASLDIGGGVTALSWVGTQSSGSSPLIYSVYVARFQAEGAPPPPPSAASASASASAAASAAAASGTAGAPASAARSPGAAAGCEPRTQPGLRERRCTVRAFRRLAEPDDGARPRRELWTRAGRVVHAGATGISTTTLPGRRRSHRSRPIGRRSGSRPARRPA